MHFHSLPSSLGPFNFFCCLLLCLTFICESSGSALGLPLFSSNPPFLGAFYEVYDFKYTYIYFANNFHVYITSPEDFSDHQTPLSNFELQLLIGPSNLTCSFSVPEKMFPGSPLTSGGWKMRMRELFNKIFMPKKGTAPK